MSEPRGRAPSVYPVREDTLLLAPFARAGPGRRVAEVGCGTGLAARWAAASGARVVATDRNRTALLRLAAVARAERLAIDCVRTDFLAGLGRFDRILANPPYLPTPAGAGDPDPGDRWALDGGPDGLRATERILAQLPEHLAPGAEAFVLFSSLQDAAHREALRVDWRRRGGRWENVAHRSLAGEELSVVRLTLAP